MWLKLAEKLIKESLSAQYHLRGLSGLNIPKERQKLFEIIKRKGETIFLTHTLANMPFPIEELDSALRNQNDPRKMNMLSTKLLGTASNEGRNTAHEQVFFTTDTEPKSWLTSVLGGYFLLVFEIPIADLLETQIMIFGSEFENWLIEKYDYNNEKLNGMDTEKSMRDLVSMDYPIDFSLNINDIITMIKSNLNHIGNIELTTLNILPMRYLLGIVQNGMLIYTNPNKSISQLITIDERFHSLEIPDSDEYMINPNLKDVIEINDQFENNYDRNYEDIKKYILQMKSYKIKISSSILNKIVNYGNLELIELALETGSQSNEDTFKCAVDTSNIDIMHLLLKYRLKINQSDLLHAIKQGNIDFIELAKDAGLEWPDQLLSLSLTSRNKYLYKYFIDLGITPSDMDIVAAIQNRNLDALKTFRKYVLTFHLQDLNYAVDREFIDGIHLILGSGVKPNHTTFMAAVKTKNPELVQMFPNINISRDMDILNVAINSRNLDIVEMTLAAGGTIEETSLYYAFRNKEERIINLILDIIKPEDLSPDDLKNFLATSPDYGTDILKKMLNKANVIYLRAIDDAIEHRCFDLIPILAQHGAPVSQSALGAAIRSKNKQTIDLLLQSSNLNAAEIDSETIDTIIYTGNIDLIKQLLDMGIKISITNIDNAFSLDRTEIIKLFIDTNQMRYDVCMSYAVLKSNIDIIKYIIDKGFTINAEIFNAALEKKNDNVINLLYINNPQIDQFTINEAIRAKSLDVVKYALDNGAQFNRHSLNDAVRTEDENVVQFIYQRGAKCADDTLFYAAKTGNVEIVKMIIDFGAPCNDYCLEHPIRNNNTSITKMLIDYGCKITDINISNAIHGKNPIMFKLIMEGLIKQGISEYEITLIYDYIISLHNIDLLRMVASYGIIPNTNNLNRAFGMGSLGLVREILHYGVQPNYLTFYQAMSTKDPKLIDVALEIGADPPGDALHYIQDPVIYAKVEKILNERKNGEEVQ